MKQSIIHIALVVREYDEAIAFYVDTLGFRLVEDTYISSVDGRVTLTRPLGVVFKGCTLDGVDVRNDLEERRKLLRDRS